MVYTIVFFYTFLGRSIARFENYVFIKYKVHLKKKPTREMDEITEIG